MTGRANMTGRDLAHQGCFLAPAGYPGQCVESCAGKSINLKKEYICIEVRVNEYYYYIKMHQRYPCNCDKQRRKALADILSLYPRMDEADDGQRPLLRCLLQKNNKNKK